MSNLVPEGWSVKKVVEFTEEHKQGYYTKNPYSEQGTYLIRITDLNNPKIDYSDMPRLVVDEKEYDQFKVKVGDFLFARSGAIGRYGIVSKSYPSVFASYLIRFRFDESLVSTRYFGYAYESDICQSQLAAITQGSSNININADNIKSLSVPFPPLPEQKKIAAILTSVDEVIEKTQAQIDKLKDLKTGMMQELLTRGVGVDGKPHTEFKDSPVGRIPKGWEVLPLANVVERVIDCEHKTAPYVEKSEFMVVRTSNVRSGELLFEDMKFTHSEGYSEWTKRAVPSVGDVLFTREAPAGESCLVPEGLKICMGQRMVLLRPNRELVHPCFFSMFLTSEAASKSIYELSIGTTVSRINIEDIKRIPCMLPPLDEQLKISRSIQSVQRVLDTKQRKLLSLQNNKKALMQDLLTGKVRVKVDS
ncbi:restriction endonuclease subunit S [Vibrio parahaemolyticus]|nr:restriction endonuclease subunit S [Vibrio parahaemolyticus]